MYLHVPSYNGYATYYLLCDKNEQFQEIWKNIGIIHGSYIRSIKTYFVFVITEHKNGRDFIFLKSFFIMPVFYQLKKETKALLACEMPILIHQIMKP